MAEITEEVRKFLSGRSPKANKVRCKMLKASECCKVVTVGIFIKCLMENKEHTCKVTSQCGGSFFFFFKGVVESVFQEITLTVVFLGKYTPGCWIGQCDRLSSLGFRRSSVAFALRCHETVMGV